MNIARGTGTTSCPTGRSDITLMTTTSGTLSLSLMHHPAQLPRPRRCPFAQALVQVYILVFCLSSLLGKVSAKISTATCSGGSCVQHNHQNTPCFHPTDEPQQPRLCPDGNLKATLRRHIESKWPVHPSISHYAYDTAVYLGGADWSLSSRADTAVVLCATGMLPNQRFITTCQNVTKDDEFTSPEVATDGECHMLHVQGRSVLKDSCCGPPRSICPPPEPDLSWVYLVYLRKQWLPMVSWVGIALTVATIVTGRIWRRSATERSSGNEYGAKEKTIMGV
ncbi:hypothetical protein BKA62DRAFT_152875 [Auriculariales sp. MPI-PUGE-AT-0066]|nr:hypothetical protein BKA62DRAFT_152875 [Auriculariales sp. MPI-PUGE-AT-0066]